MRAVVVCALFVLVACKGKEAYTPPPAPPEKPTEPPPPKKKLIPDDFGTCTLEATGGFTAEETIPGDKKSAATKYWQAEDERTAAPLNPLTIVCAGKDIRLSIAAAPNADVPYGLKKYDIKKNGELVLSGRAGDQLSDFNGTVEINAFDKAHVAGTVSVSAKIGLTKKKVQIDGNFDFKCPGMAGCLR
jgi:hypothetical protein